MRALVRILPDFLVRFFARPYVAGDSLEDGVTAARDLLGRGITTTLDLLYEGITSDDEVATVRRTYADMVDACAAFDDAATRPSVSLKPSSFTTRPLERGRGMDATGSEEAIRAIVARARERGVAVTIDMEDRHWTDWTLDLHRRLLTEGQDHVGIVLQTRLHRTEADLEALPPGCRVRLVIGIYVEPPEHATTDKKEMKRRMLAFAGTLLGRGHVVELATHDEGVVRRFLDEVVPAAGVGPDRYEVQMLYGVPRAAIHRQLVEGRLGAGGPVRVRLYVPFATSWKLALAYLRRRLLENPSMAFAVARNLLRALSLRR
ncbi:MAG: proline dehydrogenase family protein [Planctomycetota bacterium]